MAVAGASLPAMHWKQLLVAALDSNAHLKHSSFLQLATIDLNGRPSNRTVVFRGFLEDSDKIQINTDGRSHKIEEINRCPFGEICWYFTDSWEQFRINGLIDIVDGSNQDPIKLQQREKSWFSSSLKSRSQYLGSAPGLPCLHEESTKENNLDPSTCPVDAFSLLIFEPEKVDYLNLRSNERFQFLSTRTADNFRSWTLEKDHYFFQAIIVLCAQPGTSHLHTKGRGISWW